MTKFISFTDVDKYFEDMLTKMYKAEFDIYPAYRKLKQAEKMLRGHLLYIRKYMRFCKNKAITWAGIDKTFSDARFSLVFDAIKKYKEALDVVIKFIDDHHDTKLNGTNYYLINVQSLDEYRNLLAEKLILETYLEELINLWRTKNQYCKYDLGKAGLAILYTIFESIDDIDRAIKMIVAQVFDIMSAHIIWNALKDYAEHAQLIIPEEELKRYVGSIIYTWNRKHGIFAKLFWDNVEYHTALEPVNDSSFCINQGFENCYQVYFVNEKGKEGYFVLLPKYGYEQKIGLRQVIKGTKYEKAILEIIHKKLDKIVWYLGWKFIEKYKKDYRNYGKYVKDNVVIIPIERISEYAAKISQIYPTERAVLERRLLVFFDSLQRRAPNRYVIYEEPIQLTLFS